MQFKKTLKGLWVFMPGETSAFFICKKVRFVDANFVRVAKCKLIQIVVIQIDIRDLHNLIPFYIKFL